MITIKTSSQLDSMRKAGAVVAAALKAAERCVKAGVTTLEVNAAVEDCILAAGAVPSFKNYRGFPFATCISINDVVVHGFPSPRILKEGEIVSVDVGAKLNGYHGDAARTFLIGKVAPAAAKLVEVTQQSFFEGIKFARAGRRLGDLSHAVQAYAQSFGYGVVREMVGHGIGAALHEDPNVPNYGVAGTGVLLKKGFTLAVEPMITAGGYRIKIDGDGWTCRTVDGSLSAHYENTIIITDGEPEILTLY